MQFVSEVQLPWWQQWFQWLCEGAIDIDAQLSAYCGGGGGDVRHRIQCAIILTTFILVSLLHIFRGK